jgi:phosphoribosyl 1,2-cyclic phosphodiesterase
MMAWKNEAEPAASLSIRFWGVRGSIACPGPDTARYGGNTPCVEVRCGDHILIFDAGTGLRPLGDTLVSEPHATEFDIFLSHFHIDHVTGLPFFAPLYEKDRRIRVWAGNLAPQCSLDNAVHKLMGFPLFPVQPAIFQAGFETRDFRPGDTLSPRPGVTLRTARLNHPGGSTGYRIDYGSNSVAYLTDIECGDGPVDPTVLALARGAELIIVDTMYTDEELPSKVGWGHSSWQQGVRLANAAGAGQLCLFHHDPEHNDAFMDGIARAADAARPGTIVASEGLEVELPARVAATVLRCG